MPVGYTARNQACFISSGLAQGLCGPGHSCPSPTLCPKAKEGAGFAALSGGQSGRYLGSRDEAAEDQHGTLSLRKNLPAACGLWSVMVWTPTSAPADPT